MEIFFSLRVQGILKFFFFFYQGGDLVFQNSKISTTVAELHNQTAQRNAKRTAFQFQAQPNIYLPVSTSLIATMETAVPACHKSAGHKK